MVHIYTYTIKNCKIQFKLIIQITDVKQSEFNKFLIYKIIDLLKLKVINKIREVRCTRKSLARSQITLS